MAKGVVVGTCGLRGSRERPETVRPIVGCFEAKLLVERGREPLDIMSPEIPAEVSVVRVGSSSMCRRLGAFDITIEAPRVEVLGL